MLCEDFFTNNIKEQPYEEIPLFLRNSNEHTGWGTLLEDHVVVNGDELISAFDHMNRSKRSEWLDKNYRNYSAVLTAFAKRMVEKNIPLFLIKT